VIVRTIAMRQEILFVSESALNAGIRPGLTLTEARALRANLIDIEHDPARDARATEALARWMMRFSPLVSLADDSIYLDLTGCDRAMGGIAKIVGDVTAALRRFRLCAGVAVAPTPGAAWAIASFGQTGSIIPPDQVESALAPLPVAGLRLDEALRQSLHHLGIETIGQMMKLPRAALPSRFGPVLLERLDQALGRISEPLTWLPWRTCIEAKMEFDGPITSWEAVWMVFQRLIGQIVAELVRRGCGARRIEVEFFRADKQIIRQPILLSRPSRDEKKLFNLIRSATENVDGGDDGFLAIAMHSPLIEPLDAEQIALLGADQYEAQIELASLLERLSVRFGEGILSQAELVESHIPERAFAIGAGRMRIHHEAAKNTKQFWSEENHSRSEHDTKTKDSSCSSWLSGSFSPRPLQLLGRPMEIQTVVSPSEDRDGHPILFRRGGQVHRLRHAIGPERIAGQWWRGHDKTRDYFDVEDEAGRRYWLFRVNETARWFVHGVFT
jgi:protein ImuB